MDEPTSRKFDVDELASTTIASREEDRVHYLVVYVKNEDELIEKIASRVIALLKESNG